jgi:hypothetical protein
LSGIKIEICHPSKKNNLLGWIFNYVYGMKKILMLLLLSPILALGQEAIVMKNGLPVREGRVVFESVVDVPGKSKSDIYAAIKKWLFEVSDNSKRAIQSEDITAGQLLAKSETDAKVSDRNRWYTVEFDIQVTCKDNRYRLRFYNMNTVKITAGIISSDLRDLDGVIPLESNVGEPGSSQLSSKQLMKVVEINNHIADHFNALLKGAEKAVKQSAIDDF